MQLFYVSNVQGTEITLDESESKHVIRVLRLNAGDKVQVVDGKGGFSPPKLPNRIPKNANFPS